MFPCVLSLSKAMATKIAIGYSQNLDSFSAGTEATRLATYQLGRLKTDLIIAFISPIYEQGLALKGIRSIAGDAPMLGSSSIASITSKGSFKDSVTICAISFDNISFSIAFQKGVRKDPRTVGSSVARKALSNATIQRQLYMMFSDSFSVNASNSLIGAHEILGTLFPVIGGSSAHNFQYNRTYQYFNYNLYEDVVIGLLLSGNFTAVTGSAHGWQPIGTPHDLTKAKLNIIKEIDKRPAIALYQDYLGKSIDELKNEGIARIGASFPLGMKLKGKEAYLLRSPIDITEDGGLVLNANVLECEEINLMIGDRDSALNATKKAAMEALDNLKNLTPSFGMVYSDISRFQLFRKDPQIELDAIKDIIGENVPLIGCYTCGVYMPIPAAEYTQQFYFQNQVLSVTLFSE